MSNKHYWTEERRQEQRDRINAVKPWLKSTGAKTEVGKATVSRNAYKGGIASNINELIKQANAMFKEQKEAIKRIV
ncbi:hypothetical protein F908_01245 [Acinetobacter sp. NIPH 284]|uniref:hypothetical protein n=1 Tax=Acinetobacter sp. NIPH 284 TaxID=1217704 RepID=UPI0002CD71ED|nr:hypothetical protein [Acinetobacter sp. NIPH 284]ENW83296.1 hypothetical protein F908_01245 [Acinetobacter sp. NIPH 284]